MILFHFKVDYLSQFRSSFKTSKLCFRNVTLDTKLLKPLRKEVMKRRWRMIGHILRKDKDSDEMIALTWAQEGKRRKGRPKTTWRRTVEKERKELGWNTWEEARAVAVNRDRWRSLTEALCTTRCEEDR